MVGRRLTVTLDTAAAAETQPSELVPVTEYCVLDVGDTMAVPLEYV